MDYYSYNFNPNNLSGDSVKSRRRAFLRKSNLRPQFFRGKKVLEIGPGEGWDMLTMLKSGARTVDSLEYSRGIVRDLKIKFRSYPNIRVRHGDAMKLPFKANQFDFVYANGVMPHVKDPLQVLKEMVRVTRKGGVVWVSVYGKKGANNYLNRFSALRDYTFPCEPSCIDYCEMQFLSQFLREFFPEAATLFSWKPL